MRSVVVSGLPTAQLPPGSLRRSLLPHHSSSSQTGLLTSRRAGAAAAAAARDSSADSDSQKRNRSRHYYDSTPRHKSKSSSGDGADSTPGSTPSVTDAVADALSASFGGIDVSSSSSSSSRRGLSSRGGSSSRGRGGGRGRGVSTADGYRDDLDDEDDEEVQGRGWWEVPREQRWGQAAAGAAESGSLQLEPWQEEQLLLAAASSKKKMQVQTVAANVGLDRTEVLAWVAAFRAKPKSEQTRLLAPLQQQIQHMKAQQDAQSAAAQAAEDARRGRSSQAPQQPPLSPHQQQQYQEPGPQQELQSQPQPPPRAQQQQQQQGPLPFSGKGPDTGFLPFSERRAGSSGRGGKRLSGEVLRTLEGVYARSPWPNKEVVAGLFDLHRIPRDTVMDWFAARRAMDNLPDNPRAAKQLAASAKRALDTAWVEPLLPAELLPQPRTPKQQQQQQPPAAVEVGAAGGSASAPQQQQQQQERGRMQSITAREMAALRSALPSPRKQKGEKLKQELGVKAGPTGQQVEIAGVTFVAKDGAAGWRKVWRKRRSAGGVPAQQLDLNMWLLRKEQLEEQEEQEQQD